MPVLPVFCDVDQAALIERYVKTGKVRLEYHYFPLQQHEPGATMSALAAECAADQGMFWPYHDRVFQMAKVDQQGAVQFDDLVGMPSGMGMDDAEVPLLSEQPGAPRHDHRFAGTGAAVAACRVRRRSS